MFGSPAFPIPTDKSVDSLTDKIVRSESTDSSGVGFAEVMSGFIHAGEDLGDFEHAAELARSRSESARFFLSVKSWDISECECRNPQDVSGSAC
jgi:hypothetical protein